MCNAMEFYHIPVFLLVHIFISRDVYEGTSVKFPLKLQTCKFVLSDLRVRGGRTVNGV